MGIDTVAYEEALERPSLTVRRGLLGRTLVRLLNLLPGVEKDPERKTYTGRLLSHPEFERHRQRFVELSEDGTEEEAEEALWNFCVAQRIPPDKVLALPGPIQEAVIADFFLSQARANGRWTEGEVPEAWAAKIRQVAELMEGATERVVRERGWSPKGRATSGLN